MRVRRLAILAGLAGVGLMAAPAALGCELTNLSAQGANGTTVHAGDTITYTLYARTTADSPDDSPYSINIDSHGGLAQGYAAPNANGGEWSETKTFTMPDLGAGTMDVTVSAVTATQYLPAQVKLHYVGAAAPSPSATTQPAPAQPGAAGGPAVQSAPANPSPDARPVVRHGSAPQRDSTVQRRRHVRRAAPAQAVSPPAIVRAVPATAAAPAPAARLAPRPAHRAHPRAAPQQRAAPPRRDERIVPSATPAHHAVAAPEDGIPVGLVLAVAIIALGAGGGGAYALARRRAPRPPAAPVAIDVERLIEAELQEIIAERRASTARDAELTAPP